jgi:hypothetical protein
MRKPTKSKKEVVDDRHFNFLRSWFLSTFLLQRKPFTQHEEVLVQDF